MQFVIRLTLAVIASAVSMALSWPYWRDFEYWAESQGAWLLYFGGGFVLAVGVFYLFFESLGTLFEHDHVERQARATTATTTVGAGVGLGNGDGAGEERS